MPTGLKRDLGLPATTAIAIGAMVGSGIFILPGLAFIEAGGAAVVMAFLVASILILPAALSASEMATAMPEDGGSYVYVERGMGPLFGTIAGVGNWFMLSFKGALALVGGAPYVVYVLPALAEVSVPVFGDPIVPLALLVGLFFVLLNVVSTSSTGSLQFVIVGIMVVVMGAFVVGGFPDVRAGQAGESVSLGDGGFGGFVGATALVFISYAGVIKVSAVAEEVKDPGRIIPQAMLASLVLTTALYVAVVYVAIGVVDVQAEIAAGNLQESGEGAIMAIAAENTIGTVGVVGVVLAALLALASTANAGLLSASRFPFAMARDDLAPPRFEVVSERFNTPAFAVGVTGGIMLLMIATLPIEDVAKFGSAFQILVFILVNLALIGFREGAVEGYDPVFTSPLYPWMQLFGMAGGFLVLTQIGTVPLVGAALITALSVIYYYVYVRPRVDREGAAQAGVRERLDEQAVERTRALFESRQEYDVLVAITEDTTERAREDMLRVATDLGRLRTTVVSVVEFLDVPHRMFAEDHAEVHEGAVPDWVPTDPENAPDWFPTDSGGPDTAVGDDPDDQLRTSGGVAVAGSDDSQRLADAYDTTVEYREIDSENHRKAIVDFATYEAYDLLMLERRQTEFYRRVFGDETEWLLENAPCDVVLVEDRGFEGADEIAVVTSSGHYDPLKLLLADAIAEETGAQLNLLQAIPEDAPDSRREAVEAYHTELLAICTVPTRTTVIETDDEVAGLSRFVGDADLLVTGVERAGFRGRVRGGTGNELVEAVGCTALMVQTHEDSHTGGLARRILMGYVFG